MPWVYLDDHIDEHDKTINAGDAAFGFWVRLVAFCRRKQNGGRIPKGYERLRGQRTKLARLLDVGYLEDQGDHYQIHDYDAVYFKEDEERQRRSEKAKKAADARWNARSNAQASGEQCSSNAPTVPRTRERAPVPTPQPLGKPSSSSGTVVAPAEDDDEGSLLEQAVKLLAVRRLASREAEKGAVGNPDRWLASVERDLLTRHADEADSLLRVEGPWNAERLANALEPPAAADSKPLDPLEVTAAAAAELRRRQQLPPCETCDSTGWLTDRDPVEPCTDCTRAAVA